MAALPSSSQRRLVRIDVLTNGSDLHEGVVHEPHLPESLFLPGFVARELRHCLVGHLVDVDCPEELHLRVCRKAAASKMSPTPAAASGGSSSRRRYPRAPTSVDPWPTVGTPSLGEPRGERRSAALRLVAVAVEDVHELLLSVDPWPTVDTPSLGEPRGERRSAALRLVAAAVEDLHQLLLSVDPCPTVGTPSLGEPRGGAKVLSGPAFADMPIGFALGGSRCLPGRAC